MELEALKKKWLENNSFFHSKKKYTSFEISTMIKSSKTNIKGLFLFTALEFFLWSAINVLISLTYDSWTPESFTKSSTLLTVEKLNYIFLIVFIVAFYISYRKISIKTDLTRFVAHLYQVKLLTVYYIVYNIMVFALSFLLSAFWELNNNPMILEILSETPSARSAIIKVFIITSIFCSLIIGFIYWTLFSGRLKELSKLKRNISEF